MTAPIDEWVEEIETTHIYHQHGHTFRGWGPSMDPHFCHDPTLDRACQTIILTRKVTPWVKEVRDGHH